MNEHHGRVYTALCGTATARKGRAMRLYSWRTGEGCGDVLVEPRWLAWAPDGQAVALAYPDALVMCRTQPAFSAFAALPLRVRPVPARRAQLPRTDSWMVVSTEL